ncbi:MAG: SDR family NAD(P)-dependent oxidoreductase [Bacteroidetes bacterium]|nr:SDR family NAD(P)-dependent oxidoreductase [Bacteroidota bacterium]
MSFLQKYGPWAIITGASSGIGEEYAKQLAPLGFNLILVARRAERLALLAKKLEADYNINCQFIECDLSADGFEITIISATKDLDVRLLINNAGMNIEGDFYRGGLERNLQMTKLNMIAPFILSYHFAKKMAENGGGGIIFTGSISSFKGLPYLTHYAATKAYVLQLAEGMNYEFKDRNVDILCLCPGFTITEMTKGLKKNWMTMEVGPVVKEALEGLGKQSVVIPGFVNKAMIGIEKHFLTRQATTNLNGNLMKKMLPGARKKK